MTLNLLFNRLDKTCFRLLFILSIIFLFSSIFLLSHKGHFYRIVLPPLENHLYPNNFSTIYENIVLLSCSSDSYTAVYCYYLPYIALAWRRLGFEPMVFLVGSDETFAKMPLMNLLKNDLKIRYYLINVDSSRSISTSQLIRLFGGFLSYEYHTTKDLFILIADVDLLPISRSRFEINSNDTNYILAVNAYCCPDEEFSHENFHHIHYYPMSYVGMNKYLWRKIFLPLDNCSMISNLIVDMMECCLKARMNITIPKNVVKGSQYWDIDQKLLSLLIARAKYLDDIYVDKRPLGHRLDPNKQILNSEFDSILFYDDIHLPNQNEDIIFSNHTWNILSKAFANLFHSDTIELLSRYHYQTAACVRSSNRTNMISSKDGAS